MQNVIGSMYSIYDSMGKPVKTGFPSYIMALSYKWTYGNSGWYIK